MTGKVLEREDDLGFEPSIGDLLEGLEDPFTFLDGYSTKVLLRYIVDRLGALQTEVEANRLRAYHY